MLSDLQERNNLIMRLTLVETLALIEAHVSRRGMFS